MAIVSLNLTEYLGPETRFDSIRDYAEAVDLAISIGRLSGPFTSTCPECGFDFSDTDEAYEDTEHIIVSTTSDTFAVVVACEGYFVVNPNLVGIDSPNWQGPDDETSLTSMDMTAADWARVPDRDHGWDLDNPQT